jgi:hypothetical protein
MARSDFAELRGEAKRLPSRAFRVVAITLATGESLRTLVRSTDWMPVRVPRRWRSDAADSNAWIVRSLTIGEALPRRRSIWLCLLEPQSVVRCLVFKGLVPMQYNPSGERCKSRGAAVAPQRAPLRQNMICSVFSSCRKFVFASKDTAHQKLEDLKAAPKVRNRNVPTCSMPTSVHPAEVGTSVTITKLLREANDERSCISSPIVDLPNRRTGCGNTLLRALRRSKFVPRGAWLRSRKCDFEKLAQGSR